MQNVCAFNFFIYTGRVEILINQVVTTLNQNIPQLGSLPYVISGLFITLLPSMGLAAAS